MAATATATAPIEFTPAGLKAARLDVRAILERETAGKSARGDAARLAQLAEALSLSGVRLAVWRGAVRLVAQIAVEVAEAKRVMEAARAEKLEAEFKASRDIVRREQIKAEHQEALQAERCAIGTFHQRGALADDIRAGLPALFTGADAPDRLRDAISRECLYHASK